MFGFGTSIRTIHNDFEELIKLQKNVVGLFGAEIKKIHSEKEAAARDLQGAVKALIPVGDDQRYAEITKASQQAGATFDCSALVTKWRQQDLENRTRRSVLEKQWGTRQDVAVKEAHDRETLEITKQALGETVTEIDEFDKTTANIEAHNKKYPKHQITLESHDGFENTSIWRRLGYYTYVYRGPHAAYRALGSYTQENRDYYEYAAEVASMRETRKGLEAKAENERKTFEEISAVAQEMDSLDSSYRGPDGIARQIRSMVSDFLLEDDDFAIVLNDYLKVPEAQQAALAVAKSRTLASMAEGIELQKSAAAYTLRDLNSPMDTLQNALFRIGSRNVSFDMDAVERKVNEVAGISRANVRLAQHALQAVEDYQPAEGTGFYAMQNELQALADVSFDNNKLDLDFGSLEQAVHSEVREYEAEQRRKREAEEAAARRAREAMRSSFEAAARTRSSRTGGLSGGFGTSVSGGSRGIGSRSSGVSSGSRGIGSSGSSGVSRGRRGIG